MLGFVDEAEKPIRRRINVTSSSPASSKVNEFLSNVIRNAFRIATSLGGKNVESCKSSLFVFKGFSREKMTLNLKKLLRLVSVYQRS